MEMRFVFKCVVGKFAKAKAKMSLPIHLYACIHLQVEALCVLAHLKSCSSIDCCELASEWRIFVAAGCLDGSCLHLTYHSNLYTKLINAF